MSRSEESENRSELCPEMNDSINLIYSKLNPMLYHLTYAASEV